jgi:alpha-tubulin suppressor-like RCC1 family protein
MKHGWPSFVLLLTLLTAGCGGDGAGEEWKRPARLGEEPVDVSCASSPCLRDIAFGTWHVCAVTDDARVLCWGFQSEGATGQPAAHTPTFVESPTEVPGVAAELVDAGGSNSCVQHGNGLTCWGYLNREDDGADITLRAEPEQLLRAPIAQQAVAERHICVLQPDGIPACYGANDFGQLGRVTARPADYPEDLPDLGFASFEFLPSTTVSHVQRLSARSDVTCAIDWKQHVVCWGLGISGVLGFGELKRQLEPIEIPTLDHIIDISVGDFHACAVDGGGNVSCWGKDILGSIGSADENYFPPRVVNGISNAVQVACSRSTSCAIVRGGDVWCWGSNSAGQLGDGTEDDERHPLPVKVDDLEGVVRLRAGDASFCALLHDGSVRCWGDNSDAELGIGPADDEPHAPVSPSFGPP